jgi:hypothetical protein
MKYTISISSELIKIELINLQPKQSIKIPKVDIEKVIFDLKKCLNG